MNIMLLMSTMFVSTISYAAPADDLPQLHNNLLALQAVMPAGGEEEPRDPEDVARELADRQKELLKDLRSSDKSVRVAAVREIRTAVTPEIYAYIHKKAFTHNVATYRALLTIVNQVVDRTKPGFSALIEQTKERADYKKTEEMEKKKRDFYWNQLFVVSFDNETNYLIDSRNSESLAAQLVVNGKAVDQKKQDEVFDQVVKPLHKIYRLYRSETGYPEEADKVFRRVTDHLQILADEYPELEYILKKTEEL